MRFPFNSLTIVAVGYANAPEPVWSPVKSRVVLVAVFKVQGRSPRHACPTRRLTHARQDGGQ